MQNWTSVFPDFWKIVLDLLEDDIQPPTKNYSLVCKHWNEIIKKHPLRSFKKFIYEPKQTEKFDVELVIIWKALKHEKSGTFRWRLCDGSEIHISKLSAGEDEKITLLCSYLADQKDIRLLDKEELLYESISLMGYKFKAINIVSIDEYFTKHFKYLSTGHNDDPNVLVHKELGMSLDYDNRSIKKILVQTKNYKGIKKLKNTIEPFAKRVKLW